MLLLSSALLAEALTLKGRVGTDDASALPYASVYLPDVKIGATTDLDGNYRLRNVPTGRHTIVVSYVGYATQTFDISFEDDVQQDVILHEQEVTLSEIFVTPTGESIERFILSQVVGKTRKLSKVVSHFGLTRSVRTEQRNNQMKTVFAPHIKVVDIALGLLGLKKVFHYVMDNPDFKIELSFNGTYDKGKLGAEEYFFGQCQPAMDREVQASWAKMLQKHNAGIGYDEVYERMANIKKELEKMDRKSPGESAKALRYIGGYEENGHSIHILGYKDRMYHIVDGCWQIRRVVRNSSTNRVCGCMEFGELVKDVYLPVSVYMEQDLGVDKLIKDNLEDLKKMKTDQMKPSELEKHRRQIADLERLLESEDATMKNSVSYVYKDFR